MIIESQTFSPFNIFSLNSRRMNSTPSKFGGFFALNGEGRIVREKKTPIYLILPHYRKKEKSAWMHNYMFTHIMFTAKKLFLHMFSIVLHRSRTAILLQ